MISKYRSYPNYKDSGVDWLGDVPVHWNVSKMISKLSIFTNSVSADEINNHENVFHYSIPNFDEFKDGFEEEGDSIDSNKYLIDRKLLLISKLNPRKNRVFIATPKDILTVCSTEFVPIEFKDDINPDFLVYLFSSEYVRQFLDSRVNSVTNSHKRVSPHLIPRITLPIPNIEEQIQIRSFLDINLNKIENIIVKNLNLIELLQKKRISLITNVVTKGINCEELVDGPDFFGKIPNDWKFKKLKYLTETNKNNLSENEDPNLEISYLDISNVSKIGKIISTEDMVFENAPSRARRIPDNKNIIISTVRTYLKSIAFLEDIPKNLVVSTGFAVIGTKNNELYPKFLYYIISSEPFVQLVVSESKGVVYPAINSTELSNFYIVYPKLKEQIKISDYLDIETRKIDSLIEKITAQIFLLKEYKTSLISHAVTGKIDVRQEAKL